MTYLSTPTPIIGNYLDLIKAVTKSVNSQIEPLATIDGYVNELLDIAADIDDLDQSSDMIDLLDEVVGLLAKITKTNQYLEAQVRGSTTCFDLDQAEELALNSGMSNTFTMGPKPDGRTSFDFDPSGKPRFDGGGS
jgi:hypothetical protein